MLRRVHRHRMKSVRVAPTPPEHGYVLKSFFLCHRMQHGKFQIRLTLIPKCISMGLIIKN